MTQEKASPAGLYEKAVKRARSAISAVKPDQMKKPTPCTEWDVAALLDHTLKAQASMARIIAGVEVPPTGDPQARLDAASSAILKAVRATGGMDKIVKGWQGEVPASEMLGRACNDLSLHTWDLAKATGQDTKLDADVVSFLLPIAEGISKRGPNPAYKPPLDLPAKATPQDRLLALTGRKQ